MSTKKQKNVIQKEAQEIKNAIEETGEKPEKYQPKDV